MENCAILQMVGEDKILQKGEQLVVCSKVYMDEWEVQEKRKTIIYVYDEAWWLVGKDFTKNNEIRYLLEPWPNIINEIPGRLINYNEEYVRVRDEAVIKKRMESWIYPALYYLRGMIGFLPSRIKSNIETEYGVSARDATIISIFFELLLFFMYGIILAPLAFGTLINAFIHTLIAPEAFDTFILAFIIITPFPILLIDLVMRYSSYLRDDISPLGVFEWVRMRRKNEINDVKRQKKNSRPSDQDMAR